MRVQKGDTVQVMRGKDAGRTGRVVRVLPERRKVVVEGVNIYKKHLKGDGRNKQSGIIDVAKPMDVSNVMVVCQECGKPSRIGYTVKGKQKIRVCKKCGKNPSGKPVKEKKDEKKKSVAKKSTAKKSTAKKTTKRKASTKKSTKK